MDTETLIYAVIAVAVFARLWSVLGRRNEGENDRERPNPFAAPPPRIDAPSKDVPFSDAAAADDQPPLLKPLRSAPDSLAGGLERIRAQAPSFDEKKFLEGARGAFAIIVDDFAKGDLSRAARLLGPQVAARFRNAIEARRQAGHTLENKLVRIRDAETVSAKLDGATATISVRFTSEQENVVRDARGQIVSGEEGRVEEIVDLWTFARDTASADPNWILVETKS